MQTLPPSQPPSQPETTSKTESPLLEAKPESLDELFSRDPFGYSDNDITRIVSVLRQKRLDWQVEERAGKKRASAKAPKTTAPPGLSLDDLGI